MVNRVQAWRVLLRSLSVTLLPLGFLTYWQMPVLLTVTLFTAGKAVRSFKFWTPITGFWVAACLAAVVSEWRVEALLRVLGLVTVSAGCYVFQTRLHQDDLKRLGWGGLLAVLVASLRAIQQWLQGTSQLTLFNHHHNMTGALLICQGLLLLGLTVSSGLGRALRLSCLLGLVIVLFLLTLTGSRSALIGVSLGLLLLSCLRLVRLAWWGWGGLALSSTLLVLSGFFWSRSASSGTVNMVANASFERGSLGFVLGGGTNITSHGIEGRRAIKIVHLEPIWDVLLRPINRLAVSELETYTLSAWVLPDDNEGPPIFFRVEALDANGLFLGRAGRVGWTTDHEGNAGGRLYLPAEASKWTRFAFTLPTLPEKTRYLSLAIVTRSEVTGNYGLLDALQLEQAAFASPFTPGPPLHLYAYLGRLAPRLAQLFNPLQASGGRMSMWLLSLELAARQPFLGYGFGSSEHLIAYWAPRLVADPLLHPHQFFFQLLLDGGSLTLVTFLMWWGSMLWSLRGAWQHPVIATTFAAVLAVFTANLFDNSLYQFAVSSFLFFLVGIATAIRDSEAN